MKRISMIVKSCLCAFLDAETFFKVFCQQCNWQPFRVGLVRNGGKELQVHSLSWQERGEIL